jgi:hypothetical protein
MLSMKLVRRAAVMGGLGALVAVQMVAGATSAGAQPSAAGRIGHNQEFGALVNGSNGVSSPAVIRVACPTPVTSGATGHPRAGQTVTVFQPAAITPTLGNTGANGKEIGVFFNAPPPAGNAPEAGPIFFRRYGTKKIPTSEVLPCSGSGHVFFVPFPMSPGSETDVIVPVVYISKLPPTPGVR